MTLLRHINSKATVFDAAILVLSGNSSTAGWSTGPRAAGVECFAEFLPGSLKAEPMPDTVGARDTKRVIYTRKLLQHNEIRSFRTPETVRSLFLDSAVALVLLASSAWWRIGVPLLQCPAVGGIASHHYTAQVRQLLGRQQGLIRVMHVHQGPDHDRPTV